MVAKDRQTLQTLRLISAAFKQIEVDKRVEITDKIALPELVRQVKQRQDAAKQYRDAGRDDLADKEEAEIAVIRRFLPRALSEEETRAEIDAIVASSGLAREMASMKPLMAQLKERLEGQADMAVAAKYLRDLLQG